MRKLSRIAAWVPVSVSLVTMTGCGDERSKSPISPSVTDATAPSAPSVTTPPPPSFAGRIAFVSDRDGGNAIYVANPDGSDLRRLTAGEEPTWAPDGRRLAFQRGASIYTINADGSSEMRVTTGARPAWSPDGATIAFDAESNIYTIDVDGSGRRRVVDASVWNRADTIYAAQWASWSPDGRRIAFIRTGGWDEPSALYVSEVAGGTEAKAIVPQGAWGPTSWSPDGSRIAFGGGPDLRRPPGGPTFFIKIVNADGPLGTFVFVATPGFEGEWTPAGDLVFNQFTGPGTASNSLGSAMRVFTSTSDRPLIPEATAPARSEYWDQQPTWSRR